MHLQILRLLLHKKIYPQSSSSTLSIMRYLENRHMPKSDNEDEVNEKVTEGSKWVKTDSECKSLCVDLFISAKNSQKVNVCIF